MTKSVGVFQRPIREDETVDYLVREYIANGKILQKQSLILIQLLFLTEGKSLNSNHQLYQL